MIPRIGDVKSDLDASPRYAGMIPKQSKLAGQSYASPRYAGMILCLYQNIVGS